jgi:UDP-N-acetyl-D-glucosamine dehydrogenase
MLRFTEVGFRVLGFDTATRQVAQLNRGESYIKHITSSRLAKLDGRFAATLRPAQLISLESTTYLGTTEELLLTILSRQYEVGKNFYLVFSQEREDPGNNQFLMSAIPKVEPSSLLESICS